MNAARQQEHYTGPWDAFVGVVKIFLLNQGGTVTILALLGAFVCYSLDKHWTSQSETLQEIRASECLQSEKLGDAFGMMAGSRERSEKILLELLENRKAIQGNQEVITKLIGALPTDVRDRE